MPSGQPHSAAAFSHFQREVTQGNPLLLTQHVEEVAHLSVLCLHFPGRLRQSLQSLIAYRQTKHMTEDTLAFNDVDDKFSAADLAAAETREREEDKELEGLEDMEDEEDEIDEPIDTQPTPANYVSPFSFHVN